MNNTVNVEIIADYEPAYQNSGDACVDLIATKCIRNCPDQQWFKTGVKINLPDGYVALVFARSSISKKKLSLCNGVGVIDSGYNGEIQVRFNKTKKLDKYPDVSKMSEEKYEFFHNKYYYREGDRIAQMMVLPLPTINFLSVNTFIGETDRGKNGFGSTGN